jgi:hypothetical protein
MSKYVEPYEFHFDEVFDVSCSNEQVMYISVTSDSI